MTTRRGFFKQFLGQAGVFRDELKGVRSVPLNRLNELPESVIENIRPVLFPQEDWTIEGSAISLKMKGDKEENIVHLDHREAEIFEYFGKSLRLRELALMLTEKNQQEYSSVFERVTALFFKLCSLRVCHPDSIPDDEIDRLNDKTRDKINGEV